jgi:hypothetical protein
MLETVTFALGAIAMVGAVAGSAARAILAAVLAVLEQWGLAEPAPEAELGPEAEELVRAWPREPEAPSRPATRVTYSGWT